MGLFQRKKKQTSKDKVIEMGACVFISDGTEAEYDEMIEKESGWYGLKKLWKL